MLELGLITAELVLALLRALSRQLYIIKLIRFLACMKSNYNTMTSTTTRQTRQIRQTRVPVHKDWVLPVPYEPWGTAKSHHGGQFQYEDDKELVDFCVKYKRLPKSGNPGEENLYKKCNFKKADNFECRTTWDTKNKFDFKYVELWGKNTGKANTENKYDFPPPVDSDLYFGSCILVAKDENTDYIDITIEQWNEFYEKLFGGFEDLNACALEDENEEDELDNIPMEMKTKSGYLKDDFVVEDNEVENGSTEGSDEAEYEDDSVELNFEEYSYSDED